MTCAWILNLDGDDELVPGAPRRDPFAALERHPALRQALASLVGPGVVLARGERAPPGLPGRAFNPTPSALEALVRAGASPPSAPSIEVLRRVSDRRFAMQLPGGVPGAGAVGNLAETEAAIARLGAHGGSWVLKRLWSFAGRGRLLGRGAALDAASRRFVERAVLHDGAVVVEPWLDRLGDLAIHGFVDPHGAVAIGRPTVQRTTGAGGWLASRRAGPGDLAAGEEETLRWLADDAAAALLHAGAHGPFGVDALRAPVEGAVVVVRCEINPRYTMGWGVGMGEDRPDLPGDPTRR